ncbi:sigma-70 family RNA polymerase sigma factor [Rapidithrix thailandica]|uniref:Sigma-70 family RNA polymerase sigma factor n=1 Tax=Rapidithrix thailandica TaxID=413964 RepID=A0AAW9SAC6_9BACT
MKVLKVEHIRNDEQLWRAFKQGDKNALSEIYYAQYEYLFNYGLKISREEDLVKDCIHELFCELIRKKQNLGNTDSIRFYLFKAFKRKLLKEIRKGSKLVSSESTLQENHDFSVEFSFEEQLIRQEMSEAQQQKLKHELGNLSKRQKEVIFLKFYADLSNQQIGEVMALNDQSVRSLLYKTLKKLKELMLLFFFLSFAD